VLHFTLQKLKTKGKKRFAWKSHFGLTPKGPRPFFSKNTPNLPNEFFSLFCTFNHRILS
jgi:hypothetical protein